MARIYNFSAGPSILPVDALSQAAAQLVDYQNSGMSLVEMSHRGKIYDAVHKETIALVREILSVPEDYSILFLQGGATLQFGMVPLAFLTAGKSADYVITGSWAKTALKDAKVIGSTQVVWDGESEKYTRMPAQSELKFNPGAAYAHICSNETIGGIQWGEYPDTGSVPLIMDASSDIMSRPIPWNKLSMVYAGTQKNLAPAGMALVIIKKSLIEAANKNLPAYLRYDLHNENDSLYNTPPSFTVWMTNLVLKGIKQGGGIAGVEKSRDEKASILYTTIDNSGGYYRNPVDKNSRSKMNIVWRLPSEELEKKFIGEAEKKGLDGLKGHRSVGGCRASVYNAMPKAGVQALADFMAEFKKNNG